MAPKSKSIFRQPGAQHFQLVHRSQRDPLIHDPEASTHVFKAVERSNVAKGKSREDLERDISPSDLARDKERANLGEASNYGVYYDDTEYDYMQHLRTVGMQEDGVESIMLEASAKSKDKGKATNLFDMPDDVLPSRTELPRTYESQQAVPSSIAGFQPDMDPHLRQVLEALEDEAFVDDDLADNFFGELVEEGERAPNEEVAFDFQEQGYEDEDGGAHWEDSADGDEAEGMGWEARFARFKKMQKGALQDTTSDVDTYSEGGDTIGTLPQLSVIGGKRRHKGASDASGYSMSSSSMFRGEGLTLLDERFDKVMEDYESDLDENDGESDGSDEAPELLASREDFESLMDDFLDNYEILGGKMRPVLPGDTAVDKLDTIRKSLGTLTLRVQESEDEKEDDILMPLDIDEKKDRWDCETILTTHSNLENHPRLIRARQDKSVPKIRLDPKTGLPVLVGKMASREVRGDEQSESSDTETERPRPKRVTVARSKDETKEEKKARKQAVKQERYARRADKKANKEQFSVEADRQARSLALKEKAKVRKL